MNSHSVRGARLCQPVSRIRLTTKALNLAILLCAICSGVAAEPCKAVENDSLTLEQCITIARANSPELRIADNDVKMARLDRDLVAKSRLPQFSLSAGAGYAPVALDFGYDPAVSNGGELGARIIADQTLYSGGVIGLEAKQAETQTAQRSLAWQQQDRDLLYAIRQAFIDLLAAERMCGLSDQSVVRLSEYADLVADLNQAGRAKYADVLGTQVELAQTRIDSSNTAQTASSMRLNLIRLLGMPDSTSIRPLGSLDDLLILADDTSVVVPEAPAGENLDVSAARLGVRQSRLELDMARSQWKPTVSLTADAGVMTSRENLLLPASERYRSVGYSVGISIDMPLWDRGRRKTETARSHTAIRSAEDNVTLIERDIRAEYRDTRFRLLDARHRLVSLRDIARTAEKNYLLTTSQYAAGNATASDVLFAHQSLTEISRSEIDALAEIQSLKARLDMIAQPEQEVHP